jgi:hypothetical protein
MQIMVPVTASRSPVSLKSESQNRFVDERYLGQRSANQSQK